jgi:hypothetical protein
MKRLNTKNNKCRLSKVYANKNVIDLRANLTLRLIFDYVLNNCSSLYVTWNSLYEDVWRSCIIRRINTLRFDFRLAPRCWWDLRSSGYYAASGGNSLPTFRDNVPVPDSWPLKIGPTRPETSVNYYHTTPRNIPEERKSHGKVCLRQYDLLNNQMNLFNTGISRKLMIRFLWQSPLLLLISSPKTVSNKKANVKNWQCCLKRRPRKASIPYLLPLASAWGRAVDYYYYYYYYYLHVADDPLTSKRNYPASRTRKYNF